MKKWIIILLCFYVNIEAQIEIEYLNDVPENFKKEYYKKPREYNPLHIGDVWQYYFSDYTYPSYKTTKVIGDSLINGKKYYKKVNYQTNNEPYISWERNDSISGVSFMLDFQDVDEDGDTLDELPIDSLNMPIATRYLTYRYSFNDPYFWSGPKTGYIYDSTWVVINGDTVISKHREIFELFLTEEIADKFGIISNYNESPIRLLTGAIINGKQYGILVNVDKNPTSLPESIYLYQNYPNPFNPVTTIKYHLQKTGFVSLKVYDVLGKEVITLLNENKKAGSYSIQFDGSKLASGIYYYSLIAGSKRITKSMILLK